MTLQATTKKGLSVTTFPFETFISLVRFDQDIKKARARVEQEQQALHALQAEQKKKAEELDQLKQAIHDAQKEVDSKELEMKSLDTQEKEVKHKLDVLDNVKEYEPLKRQVAAVNKAQIDLEKELVAAWRQLEHAQRAMTEKSEVIAQALEQMQTNITAKMQEIADLQVGIEKDAARRPDKRAGIPEEWLEKYDMMGSRVDNPVVPVVQGGCGGCFYNVPDQELLRLKKRALLQCQSCYRFLYDPEVLGQPEPEAQDEQGE